MLSFVIPTHNEEQFIGRCISSVTASARAMGQPFEVIVVDDASTGRTAEISASRGAKVVKVAHRQIAATRNAGAREARGEWLFFVDADTLANPRALRACLQALDGGAVGGCCVFTFDGTLPVWAKLLYPVAVVLSRTFKLMGGCYLFCTREAFDAIGGFDERYFAAEEAVFVRALKRRGRFAVPGPTVVTSGRKLRMYSGWRILGESRRWMCYGRGRYQRREGLDLWYGGPPTDPIGEVK
ncbi:MAG TPA: glycosyltransferase [Lacipirellulaceae bacterium]|nr:glycosyltransferase [Lacipirellulaceae bacterium]